MQPHELLQMDTFYLIILHLADFLFSDYFEASFTVIIMQMYMHGHHTESTDVQ